MVNLNIFEDILVLRHIERFDNLVDIVPDSFLRHVEDVFEREYLHVVYVCGGLVPSTRHIIILLIFLVESQVDLLLRCQCLVGKIHLLSRNIHVKSQQRCVHQDLLLLDQARFGLFLAHTIVKKILE